jgi:type IV pilus assembly protein PilW
MRHLLLNQSKKQSGLTLVELMIAMVIGLVLTGGVIQIFIANNQAYRVTENMSRVQENGRFALDNLGQIIRIAGFKGDTETSPGSLFITPTAPFIAPNVAGLFTNEQVVSGTDGGIGVGALDPSDDLFIRYRGASDGDMTDCIGTNIGQTTAFAGVEVVNRYYLNNGSLTCHSSAAPTVPQPLIDNVVRMQVLYGMTTDLSAFHDLQAECYLDASTIVIADVSDCVSGLNFEQVVSVRIKLLLSTPDDNLTPDGANQIITFDEIDIINGTTDTMADRRLYRQLTKTISLRNKIL